MTKCLLNRQGVAQWFGPDLKCKGMENLKFLEKVFVAQSCPDPGGLRSYVNF